MIESAGTPDVVDALAAHGFKLVGTGNDGWLKFTGDLQTSAGGHPCELLVDPNFFELPRVRLLSVPSHLPRVTPHLMASGSLCYIAKGSVALDIFDPVGQTLACVQRAGQVLGRVLAGEMVDDLEEEFYVYWNGPFCLVDMQDQRLGRHDTMLVEPSDQGLAVVTDDRDRTKRKLKALGWEIGDGTIITYRVRTIARPRPHTTKAWPPPLVRDLLAWQALLDPRCRRKIEKRIKEAMVDEDAKGVLILVESPSMLYGFAVRFERPANKRGMRRAPSASAYEQKVIPLSVVRIDDRYIAQRNIPRQETLAGKEVAVIGCGTIGGYLAEMLAKAGAGTLGGRLTLVDCEVLLPQNVGRHRLGFRRLFMNKAKGLEEELREAHPGAHIRGLPVDVRSTSLGRLDLLVDATGEESLGHWMCSKYAANTAMLTAWIEGPGVAVRALLREPQGGACYRCLCDANRRGQLTSVVGGVPLVLAGHGCEGLYVPFPASVSLQAAALASSIALAWANERLTAKLQTRIVDTSFQLASVDCSPPANETCPACGS